MRILLLGIEIAPEEGGGYTLSQDIFEALQNSADASRHRFFVLASEIGSEREARLPEAFVSIRVTRSRLRQMADEIAYDVKRIWRLWKRLGSPMITPQQKAIDEEVFRCGVDCCFSLVPWQWSHSLPNIITVWDLEHRRKPYFPELAATGEWERRERMYHSVLPKATVVVTGTETGKAQLQNFYGLDAEAVKVIPFPTPSFALKGACSFAPVAEQLPFGISGEYLFYPAQYWPHKNHVRLLQVVKLLHENHGWNGTLVCCGSDKGNLEYLRACAATLGIKQFVHFLGFVTQDELVALYRHALALAFVSYLGPDNLPPLEAFALGCPVIAADVDGARNSLGAAALWVDPDDAEAIAAAVWRLRIDPDLRKALLSAGKERAIKSTTANYAGELLQLFDSLEIRFQCFRSSTAFSKDGEPTH